MGGNARSRDLADCHSGLADGALGAVHLHTNDSAGAVTAWWTWGSSLPHFVDALGVLAQRLVRKICTKCRTLLNHRDATVAAWAFSHDLGDKRSLRPGLSRTCNDRGKGRKGIYELLVVNDPIGI